MENTRSGWRLALIALGTFVAVFALLSLATSSFDAPALGHRSRRQIVPPGQAERPMPTVVSQPVLGQSEVQQCKREYATGFKPSFALSSPSPTNVPNPTSFIPPNVPAGSAFFGMRPVGVIRRRSTDEFHHRQARSGLLKQERWANVSCDEFNRIQLVRFTNGTTTTSANITLDHWEQSPTPIRRNLVGLATEWDDFDTFTDRIDVAYPLAFIRLMNILKEEMGGEHMPFLIGGNSAMYARLHDSKLPPINESEIVVGPNYFPIIRSFLDQIGSKVVFAVPMLSRLPDYAVEMALRMKEVLGKRLEGIELGNEPDHWLIARKCYRNLSFTPDDYMTDAKNLVEALEEAWPNNRALVIQGPAFAGCNTNMNKICWFHMMQNFSDISPNVKFISFHRYGASGCSRFIGLRTILADPVLGNPRIDYSWIRPMAEKAYREGKEIVWSEGNVFSCGGNPCMSQSFASALWYVDNALEAAYHGTTRAMLHANPDNEYSPYMYDYGNPDDPYTGMRNISVFPLFYAMLAITRLFETDKSYIFRANIDTNNPLIKAWGVKNLDTGSIHVVVLHKDMDQTVPLQINLTPIDVAPEVEFDSTAFVWRMTPGPNDTVAGKTARIAEQWVDNWGYMNGVKTVESLEAVNGTDPQMWQFWVQPGTMAVLKLVTTSVGDMSVPPQDPPHPPEKDEEAFGKASMATPTFEVEDNVRYYGDEIGQFRSVKDMDECYLLCAQNAPVCQYFVFRKSKKACHLFRSFRDADYNQPNYVSGRMGEIDQMGASFALDPILPGFSEPEIGWQGGSLVERVFYQGGTAFQQNQGQIANTNMAQQCSDACIATDECVSFNVNMETGECQLSSAVAGKAPGKLLSPFKDFRYYERLDAHEILTKDGQ